jgi:predicted DNA-binding transcriptional regulator YafY
LLLSLLQVEGYDGFRSARGPMGFTQRQGGGKFTRDEAAALIDQLQNSESSGDTTSEPIEPAPTTLKRTEPEKATAAAAAKPAGTGRESLTAAEQAIRRIPTTHLAAELQRRGWIVVEP